MDVTDKLKLRVEDYASAGFADVEIEMIVGLSVFQIRKITANYWDRKMDVLEVVQAQYIAFLEKHVVQSEIIKMTKRGYEPDIEAIKEGEKLRYNIKRLAKQ